MFEGSEAQEAASAVIDAFIYHYKSEAIPTLIGSCVAWAVMNGGADLIRGTLKSAIDLSSELEAARMESAQ